MSLKLHSAQNLYVSFSEILSLKYIFKIMYRKMEEHILLHDFKHEIRKHLYKTSSIEVFFRVKKIYFNVM